MKTWNKSVCNTAYVLSPPTGISQCKNKIKLLFFSKSYEGVYLALLASEEKKSTAFLQLLKWQRPQEAKYLKCPNLGRVYFSSIKIPLHLKFKR